MSGFKTYTLKDKTKGSFQLPLREVMVEKSKNEGGKKIHYIQGAKSIFVEDYKGELKGKNIWFDEGKLIVPESDKMLNEILEKHPWFNVKYELKDAEVQSKRELNELSLKRKAANMVEDADDDKLQAMAMAIFGGIAMNWKKNQCELSLLKTAYEKPADLIRKLESPDYETKYIAALAFNKGIVKYNSSKTAVLWGTEDAGLIISLAKGENGITKLGEFLIVDSEEARNSLQEIGTRLTGGAKKAPKKAVRAKSI